MNFELLKTSLNTFSLVTCGFSKVPQIKRNWKAQSTEGLSLVSLLLENCSWSICFCYYVYHRYPVYDYLEYPLLLMQSVLLICLHLAINDPIKWSRSSLIIVTSAYFTAVNLLCSPEILPPFVLKLLLQLTIPIKPLSKLAQIATIVQTRRGDLISLVPWAVYASSSVARIITVAMQTGDRSLILSYSLSVFLNVAVIITAMIFNDGNTKQQHQQNHVANEADLSKLSESKKKE